MCGLILIKRLDGRDARKMAISKYQDQKARGQEGFGFLALNKGELSAYRKSETELGIADKMKGVPCDTLIFHHRLPTSTPNFEDCAHPIKVEHANLKHDYYVIHNGIVWNDEEWKYHHEKMGFKYTTEIEKLYMKGGKIIFKEKVWNDSEALAIELARDLDDEQVGIEVDGSISFIVLQTEKGGSKVVNTFWGRNDQPLVMDKLEGIYLSVCSEGKGNPIAPHTLYTLDPNGAIAEKPYQIGPKKAPMGYNRLLCAGEDDMPESKLTPDAEAIVDSLCIEYDKIMEALEGRPLEPKVEDALRARLNEIDKELEEIEIDSYMAEVEQRKIGFMW